MKIAVLAWGSLYWDPRDLSVAGEWQHDGPVLRIEFSRISRDGRLTLVIDEQHGAEVPVLYIRSGLENLNEAILNLQNREGNPPVDRIGYVNLRNNTEREWARQQHPVACDRIKAWAQTNNWDAVIWTALISNFAEKQHAPFSVTNAVAYVSSLTGTQREKALEYIVRAPPQIATPGRAKLESLNAGVNMRESDNFPVGNKELNDIADEAKGHSGQP